MLAITPNDVLAATKGLLEAAEAPVDRRLARGEAG
jgi:hypothetical protein